MDWDGERYRETTGRVGVRSDDAHLQYVVVEQYIVVEHTCVRGWRWSLGGRKTPPTNQ